MNRTPEVQKAMAWAKSTRTFNTNHHTDALARHIETLEAEVTALKAERGRATPCADCDGLDPDCPAPAPDADNRAAEVLAAALKECLEKANAEINRLGEIIEMASCSCSPAAPVYCSACDSRERAKDERP